MSETTVVNIANAPYDVYIGRPSKWGNKFIIGKDGTRSEVIRKYREYVQSDEQLMADLEELRGKVLGCYCKPQSCHGDELVKLLAYKDRELLISR